MDLQGGKKMFGDIKSKLGFGSQSQGRGSGRSYDGGYDDYDDYDDYADDYGDDYGDYADDYADDYGSDHGDDRYGGAVTTRERGTRSSAARSAGGSTMPRLVSIDDVRASTQVPSISSGRDSSYARRSASTGTAPARSLGRTMVDSSLPPQMTPEGTAAVSAAASRRHSEGLDSLFMPTDDPSARSASRGADSGAASSARIASAAQGSAVSTSSVTSVAGHRSVDVLRPKSYEEAEKVVTSLKGGNAVVLVVADASGELSKRLLDFSFGAACALGASVECVGDKTFAITCVKPLTEVERMNLRNQGVLQ